MVDIENYNRFLVGIKLVSGIELEDIKKKIRGLLNSNGYSVPEEQKGIPIKIGLPIETLGTKDNVDIKLNLQTQSFNIMGTTPDNVKSIFNEFINLLKSSYNDIGGLIPFYELVADVELKTNKNPLNTLNKSVNVNLTDLKQINPQTSIIGVRIGSMIIDLESNNHIDILVEPMMGSHSNRYQVKVRYQTKKKDDIINFQVEDKLVEIISSLEEGE